jgi:replication factor C subunit 3/5
MLNIRPMLEYTSEIKKSSGNSSLPWIEKYRPKDLDNIVSHKDIINTLRKFIEKKSTPHLLFFGPSGTGKTSTIKCCINEIYGEYAKCMTLILNASNERGIETVRGPIKTFVGSKCSIFMPPEARNIHKMVILDEIDSMTFEAQGMLRQIIEKNSSTTRFCLICNEIDKINVALQSRCSVFRFPPLCINDMKARLSEICETEGMDANKEMILATIKISNGDMRSAINILQHSKMTYGTTVTPENIYRITGHSSPEVNKKIFILLTKMKKNPRLMKKTINLIGEMMVDNNITILNLLDELRVLVIESTFEQHQKIYLLDKLATYEIADSVSVPPRIIVAGISGLFVSL